ncbi:Phosphatidylinositol 3,4,5-trisphosphate-dependent Rac exchanger 2 protein [Sporothrix stenoceras]|uniref:Phosphatidylinositol 3,4,5-trisphosphate-dependent Rac exchanger 2 protein n=1 Tax=Sporothrix stenoceras TaxID=5173 RepID=A0ABR3ZB36_9PEZI
MAMVNLPQLPLVWIDCEMTGLNPDNDVILEIYCFITDGQLNLVKMGQSVDGVKLDKDETERECPGWGAIIHVPKERLDLMDSWCTDHHGRSGLTEAVLKSSVTHEEAADGLLAYIRQYIPKPRLGLLAGSSVHADKAFLRRAPYDRVMDHLHYRILDVSTIKEAVRRWQPRVPEGEDVPKKDKVQHKESKHRARDDILDSIAEARRYKRMLFDQGN